MSNDQTAYAAGDRAGPVWALVRRWPVAVVLVVIGVAAGLLVAGTKTVVYTGEARVAVGYGDLSSGAIAGFPTAAEDLASNYSRYVNDQGLIGRNVAGSASPGNVTVIATPIPSSNVIRILTESTSPTDAAAAAGKTAKELVSAVNDPQGEETPDQILSKYQKATLTAAQASVAQSVAARKYAQLVAAASPRLRAVTRLRNLVVATTAASDEADLQRSTLQTQYQDAVQASRSADLILVTPGSLTSDDKGPRQQRYGLIGAVLGLALALAVASLLERRKLRKGRPTTTPGHTDKAD